MKKVICLLFSLTAISASANFGSPTQDPVVKLLQDKFKSAHKPTIDELKFGSSWFCKEYIAVKDDYASLTTINVFNFESFSGIIINKGSLSVGGAKDFTFGKTSLVSYLSQVKATVFVRVTSEGDLIAEVNLDKSARPKDVVAKLEPGTADPTLGLNSYIVCPLDKLNRDYYY